MPMSDADIARAVSLARAVHHAREPGRGATQHALIERALLELHDRVLELTAAQDALCRVQVILGTDRAEPMLGAAEVARELEARVAGLRKHLAHARRLLSDVIHDAAVPTERADQAVAADEHVRECSRLVEDGHQAYFSASGGFFCWECGPCHVDEDQSCTECGAAAGSAQQLRALVISGHPSSASGDAG